MGRSAINDEKHLALSAGDQPLQELDKHLGVDAPFSTIINRIWPRDVIADSKLIACRAPVASTIGVSPFLPHVRPA